MRSIWDYSPERRKAAFRSGRFAMDKDSVQSIGIVGWWPLGVHGGNAQDWDYSGFTNHGSRINGPTRKAVSHPQWGGVHVLDLDGTDDVITASDSPSLDLPSKFTIVMSANFDTFGASGQKWLVGKTDFGQNKRTYHVYWNQDSTSWETVIDTVGDASNLTYYEFSDSPSTATGYQLAFVYASSAGADQRWKMYRDGISISRSVTNNDNGGTPFNNDVPLAIGASRSSGSYSSFFNGLLNDVRTYGRDQSSSLISEIHNEPWRLVYPIGVRTISFSPVVSGTILPQISTAYYRINA